jgi:hypothetical protein
LGAAALAGPIPPAEKLLPEDTLAVVTTPDFPKARELFSQSPMSQLWRDPAMKPFRDKLVAKWDEELLRPLERELDLRFADYTGLPQGQVTFAISQNGWDGKSDSEPAFLLLVDARDRGGQLKTNLAAVRQKWVAAGKTLRLEKIRDVEFAILTLSSNDTPKTLKRFFSPPRPPGLEAPTGTANAKPGQASEFALGQFESLLILGDSTKAIEKVVARLTGGSAPGLSDVAAFEADRLARFRDAPFYMWANAKRLLDVVGSVDSERPRPDPDQPPSIEFKTILNALGLSGLNSLAFHYCDAGDGSLFQLSLGVPEPARTGLLRMLAPEPKSAAPPVFVPADVAKYQRVRIDGPKAWAAIEKAIGDISSNWTGALNLFLQTADKAGKERDPAFDLRRDLIGNLGDDLVTWQKPPRGHTLAQLGDAPSIWLIGSPNAEKLASGLRNMLAALPEANAAKEREFLGRKICTATLPMLSLPEHPDDLPKTVSYAASGGYLGFSTDVALLEEWLRSGDTPPKPLRDKPGLADALARAGGTGGGWIAYEDQAAARRALFEILKQDPGAKTNVTMGAALNLPLNFTTEGEGIHDWIDVSLLPAWDSVAKYFHYGVTSGSANADGISYRFYSPTPPGLKK